ncbi:hypothetical protein BTVI_140818 [Pitangus sulphuratus]|nr:hypothetical protein BTVI_140818 [Pitangus sulphuratus]
MAALAYTGGKREINYYFSVRSAKALALGAVLLLTACHAASRRYRGQLVSGSNTCCQHPRKARLRQFIVEMGKGVGIFMDTITQVHPLAGMSVEYQARLTTGLTVHLLQQVLGVQRESD